MGNTLLLALACGAAGAAMTALGTTIYSSDFQWSFPVGGSIKTTMDPANIWSWTGTVPPGGTNVMVDIDGDGVMDTHDSRQRVLLTDMMYLSTTASTVDVEDSSGLRWRMGFALSAPHHMTTPIVLPFRSDLHLTNASSTPVTCTLIGRVVNL